MFKKMFQKTEEKKDDTPEKEPVDYSGKLGAHWDGKGVHFSIFSEHATQVTLCLFNDTGNSETHQINLSRGEGNIWTAYSKDTAPGQVYGYRINGPHAPHEGHKFNPNVILLDPYAYEVIPPDSYDKTPRARVIDPSFDWGDDKKPNTAWSKTVIYEAHPQGFTKLNKDIPEDKRGTLSALADDAAIDHLKKMNITAIELLPVQVRTDEPHLQKMNMHNYWGYNTVNFFAPEPNYLQNNSINEFKETVKTLHKNGIEVILDVVFNHTAEGGEGGMMFSFRGIDNFNYYRLNEHDLNTYNDVTGCGNTLDISHPQVRQMVLDSLRYWAEECRVDGFRFDLAPALARDPYMFNTHAPFFKEIADDPILSKVKLIAEPWDIGPEGYQLGNFPAPWVEWNDNYRDTVRRFWRGDHGITGDFAHAVSGSSLIFNKEGRAPQSSVNFLAAHDGFTLHDTVSYERKHNEVNGENNRDGHNGNASCNYGAEGSTDNQDINDLRELQKRNMLATLFLSQGVPMLLSGDEFSNTQHGNNNAYCQDNDIGWLNWDTDKKENKILQQFVENLIDIRKENAILNTEKFLHGDKCASNNVHNDLHWFSKDGETMNIENWHNHDRNKTFAMMVNDAAVNEKTGTDKLLIAFNSQYFDTNCTLPKLPKNQEWHRILDTSRPELSKDEDKAAHTAYHMPRKSLIAFKRIFK